ncbi:TolC family outer membrane protein [Pluralibacter gergoviae]|nr:TolC family outer membrane protein [Pluralibacter gergoviae]
MGCLRTRRFCFTGLLTLFSCSFSPAALAIWGERDPAEAARISPQQLSPADTLPALDGSRPGEKSAVSAPALLSLNAAVERAVQWYPDIGSEVGKLFTASERINIARAKYYPQISGGINNSVTNTYNDGGYSPSLVLSLSQMLYDFGKVDSAVREANSALAQQQANVLLSIDKVAHDSAAALVQVQGFQQLVQIAREQLDALETIGRLEKQRNDEGASSLSDVVQTNARIEGARATLTQYQASLERWRATLTSWLGWERIGRVDNLFPEKLGQSCRRAKVDDALVPAVLASQAQMAQAAARLSGAEAQMKPTISLEPEVTHYLNDRYANHEQLDRTQYSAYVRVQMPIYQGGGLTAGRNAAQHSLEAAEAAVRTTRIEVRQQLMAAQNEALSLEQTLALQVRQLALNKQTQELYKEQYLGLGNRPLLDVLNAEQEVYQTRFMQQQTETQWRSLQLDCLYNTGLTRHLFALENRSIQGVEIRP